MPTIHVIYDPQDKVQMPPQKHMKAMGVSAGAMTINTVEIEPETISGTAEALAAILLNAIARDQEPVECAYKYRPDEFMAGARRLSCQTHGFNCPNLAAAKAVELHEQLRGA